MTTPTNLNMKSDFEELEDIFDQFQFSVVEMTETHMAGRSRCGGATIASMTATSRRARNKSGANIIHLEEFEL